MTDEVRSENGKKYIRTTISLNSLNYKIIRSLRGIKGKNITKVINSIINEWIEYNSDKFSKIWNIDIINLRKLAQMEYDDINVEKDIEKLEKKLIIQISEAFRRVKEIRIEDLAEGLEISNKLISKILLSYGEELTKAGMNFYIEKDYIFNKKL